MTSELWEERKGEPDRPMGRIPTPSDLRKAERNAEHQHDILGDTERIFVKHSHADHFEYHQHTAAEFAAECLSGKATYRIEER